MKMSRWSLCSPILLLLACSMSGCVSSEMASRVKDFSDSTSAIATTTNNAYQKVESVHESRVEADAAYAAASADPKTPLDPIAAAKSPYHNEFQLRQQVIQGLALYATNLSAIAGNQLDSDFDTQASALGSALKNVDADAVKLKLAKSPLSGSEIGIFTTAVTALGDWIIDYKRERALKEAVNQMSQPITDITKLLAGEIGNSSTEGLRGVAADDYADLTRIQGQILSHGREQNPRPIYEINQSYLQAVALDKQRQLDDALLAQTAAALLKIGQTHALLVDAANDNNPKLDDLISELKAEASQLAATYNSSSK